MSHISISKALKKGKGFAELKGWIYKKRILGGKAFVILRDGTGTMQVVFSNIEQVKKIDSLDREASLIVEGELHKDKRAPGGSELIVKKLKIVADSKEYPIAKKEHGPEFLMEWRHLALRSPKYASILRVKDSLMRGAREYFKEEGFVEVNPPIIVSAAVEGGSTLFEMKYFNKKAYLSQSAQFYLEALAYSLDRVYSITPSFRAEKSRTRRHLTEYWHLEPEMTWAGMKENLELQENLIKAMIGKAVKERKSDLEALGRNIKTLKPTLTEKFHVMKYKEAIDRVGIKFGQDFGAEEERVFSEKFDKPIFITHYPKSLKPFYMKEDPLDKQVVLNNDLLAPEGYGEIIGASVREDDYDKLFNAIKAKGYNPKDYEWYLDLRKYGSVPHAGFGLGLERVTAWLCKLEHIRDAIPFPRTVDRTKP